MKRRKAMDKKQVKQIEIVEVVKNRLSTSESYPGGEYETSCDVDFILSSTFAFRVFDKEHTIDRVKMGTSWDTTELYYANSKQRFICFPITKSLIHKVYERIKIEQKSGCLSGYSFEDDIFEMLTGERETSSEF
jgi:hypothetical protein